MGYTQVELEKQLLDMYPDVTKHGLAPMLSFDAGKAEWIVRFRKDRDEFTVRLKKKDADACMDGTYCEYFATELSACLKDLKAAK